MSPSRRALVREPLRRRPFGERSRSRINERRRDRSLALRPETFPRRGPVERRPPVT